MQSKHDILSARFDSHPAIVVCKYSTPEDLKDEPINGNDDTIPGLPRFNDIELDDKSEDDFDNDDPYDDADGEEQYDQISEDDNYGQDPETQQRSDYKDLGTLIRRCGIRHADTGVIKRFWPTKLLHRILTRERVMEELTAHTLDGLRLRDGSTPTEIVDKILHDHIKIFAVLAMVDKVDCIESVMRERLKDCHLPLDTRGIHCQLHLTSTKHGRRKLVKCFSGPTWKTHERESFANLQHAVDPRVLELKQDGRTPKHIDFEPKVVLPFVHEDRREGRQEERQYGGYGFVTVVRIHPDGHKFQNLLDSIETNDNFALKQLVKDDRREFEREVEALKVFNGFAHPHIVTLLMTWTLQGRYFLLFPLAKCDLDQYWEEVVAPMVDTDTIRWMSEQLVGIASALASIHDPNANLAGRTNGSSSRSLQVPADEHKYGRHGDLKPENILLYNSPGNKNGILVVADMGLSKLNTILSRSIQSNSRVPATPRYKPPECDIEGAKITRSYDIWTFGCLALEWVCWLFGGQTARESFISSLLKVYPPGAKKDMFFDMIPKDAGDYRLVVKPEVIKKLAELHADERCTQYLHDLLNLIEDKMMVLRAKDRIGSNELHQTLRRMDGMLAIDSSRKPYPSSASKKPQAALNVVFRRRDSSRAK